MDPGRELDWGFMLTSEGPFCILAWSRVGLSSDVNVTVAVHEEHGVLNGAALLFQGASRIT